MFRQVRRLLLLRSSGGIARGAARSLSSDPPAAPAQDRAFVGPHKKVAPNIEPPKTPLCPHPPTSTSIPSKLTVNVVLPYQTELANKEHAQESTSSIVKKEDPITLKKKKKEDPIVHYYCNCSKRCRRFKGTFYSHANWVSGRIDEYNKFKKHLEDCDNIKDDMTIVDVLNLQEVDSFRTRLNMLDKRSCINAHFSKLMAQRIASQLKVFLIYLLESNIHLEVRTRSFDVVLEELHIRFSHLHRELITRSLRDLFDMYIPKHELSGPISEDTRKTIEQLIEVQYEHERSAKGIWDPTKAFR